MGKSLSGRLHVSTAIGVSLFALALISGCTTSGKNLPVTESRAALSPNNIQVDTIRVESYFFEPSRIEVTVNVPVRLVLKSGAFIIPHNFSLHAPEAGIDIDQDVGHGKTAVVEFTPTKAGEYQYYCDKGSHADKGMTGTLVVAEK
jgi:plastocyanin